MKKTAVIGLVALFAFVSAIRVAAPDAPATSLPFVVPTGFPQPRYALERNPLTVEGVALGRTLFYESRLSRDSSIACAECHTQPYAFSHHGHDLSHGIDNQVGTRNALALQNLAWNPSFFWDGGVTDLDLLPITPIQEHTEMGQTMTAVVGMLQRDKAYRARFRAAFGTEEVTSARMLQALSQFMLTLVSDSSRYDKHRRGEVGGTLTADELAGKQLFTTKGCANCHAGPLFTDYSFRNNGLSIAYNQDAGRAKITEQDADQYTFRVPSLRNVARTFPYMHDGRFATLEAVLKHYATGVYATPNLDPLLKKSGKPGISLTATEQGQIVAFLKTLTDDSFVNNPRFGPP
jgi:cytochrome c peroxidase